MMNGFIVFTLAALSGAVTVVQAQDRSQYVISAKAGGINAVSGEVTATRRGAATSQAVTTQDNLDAGDRLTTGASGRAEMLLNPGSYLRLAEHSEIELIDTSLDAVRLKLLRGSALVEVTGGDEQRALTEVTTPQTVVVINRKGLYRVDAVNATTTVRVRKGRAIVGGVTVKDGRQIVIDRSGTGQVVKFDRKIEDSFDLWSGQRAGTLAAANQRLSRRAVSNLSSSYGRSSYSWQRGFGGFWLYDPLFSGRTFLPYYSGWSSPYGHGYRNGFGFSRYNTGFSGFGSRGGFGRFGGFGIGIGGGAHRSSGIRIGIGRGIGRGGGRRH